MKQGWKVEKLGDVLQKTETVNPTQKPNDEFLYIDVSSVNNQTFVVEETTLLKGKDAPSRARKLIKAGDVIFATVRPTLKRIAIIPEEYDGQVCSTGYFVLRAKEFISNKYLFYFLLNDGFMEKMAKLQKGASYPAVTDNEVKAQLIAYPPLSEQQRIVALLDETIAALNTVHANAQQNRDNARALFDSVLEQEFQYAKTKHKSKNITELCEIGDGNHGGNYPKKSDMRKSGVPFIRSVNLVNGHISEIDMHFISEEKHSSLKKGHLKTGDVLFTNRGEMGKSAVIDSRYDDANLNSQIAFFRCSEQILPWYLYYVLQSPYMQEHSTKSQTGAALQQLPIGIISKFEIPLPSLDEQCTIVQRLDSLAEETRKLERVYQSKLDAVEELRKTILQKAFEGGL